MAKTVEDQRQEYERHRDTWQHIRTIADAQVRLAEIYLAELGGVAGGAQAERVTHEVAQQWVESGKWVMANAEPWYHPWAAMIVEAAEAVLRGDPQVEGLQQDRDGPPLKFEGADPPATDA